MVEFKELLKTRRSIRDYRSKKVPLDLVKEIVQDSCFAPSSANSQPWRFIIIMDKETIRTLSDESKQNLLFDLENNPAAPSKKFEANLRDPSFNLFYNAPCLVFIVGSKGAMNLDQNCALAACYFMFAATERGLGTCWIGRGKHIRSPEILKLIGMSEDYQIVAPIALGYPKTIPTQTIRKAPQVLKIV